MLNDVILIQSDRRYFFLSGLIGGMANGNTQIETRRMKPILPSNKFYSLRVQIFAVKPDSWYLDIELVKINQLKISYINSTNANCEPIKQKILCVGLDTDITKIPKAF